MLNYLWAGMILVGIVLGPHCVNAVDESVLAISGDLRQIALVIILTRAGLSLNISDLKKVGRPAILMCFVGLFGLKAGAMLQPHIHKYMNILTYNRR